MSEAAGVVQRVQKSAATCTDAACCAMRRSPTPSWSLPWSPELEVAVESLAALPPPVRLVVREMLSDLADRDWYDDRHRYIRDGRTVEE